jgi:hypothetical protein
MSKFYDNHKAHEETRVKNSLRREKLASYFFDVSKLSLGGVVFTSAFGWFSDRDNGEYVFVFAFGIIMTISFAIVANRFLK